MLAPSIFNNHRLDDFFDNAFSGYNMTNLMSTDVKETDNEYEVIINLPGIQKENVKAELKNGYLTVSATTESENESSESDGKYLRKERFQGSCSRSFYVGSQVEQQDIHAKFDNGVLTLSFEKPEKKQQVVEKDNLIAIE